MKCYSSLLFPLLFAMFAPSGSFPQQGCDCEPVITGEISDGGNSSEPISSSCVSGTWSAINQGELAGYCIDCDPTHPKQCRIDYKIAINITNVTCGPAPDSISWLGEEYALGTDPSYLFVGSTAGLSFSLDCGGSRKKSVQLLDANGGKLAMQAFEFKCVDCNPSN